MSTTDPSTSASPEATTTLPTGVLSDLLQTWLAERRRERRWRTVWRWVWAALLVLLIFGVYERDRVEGNAGKPHTALIEIRGEISDEADANADQIISALRTAFEDAGSKAVVLRINSPGGSPVQAGLINDEIRRLKALHPKKKVYAVCEEMCASAAYYIAVGADDIYVDKASLVGSIGVLMDGFGFTGAMNKLGIERRLLTAGENKGILDPFSPLSEKHKAFAQVMLDQIHDQFIAVVRQGRGKRLKETDETFSGLFWNGQQAVDLGLADSLGSLDSVARDVVKAEDIVDYTPKPDLTDRLAKRFGASVGEGAARSLRQSASVLR
ncbi:MAG: S49 family peptidase [Aquabacterium sp.]|jgi:protease-4|nr:MAG: S49 family peptidase [Aquabacterium sp.]